MDDVRVVNPGEFDVDVDVAAAADDGWMSVGTAINRHTTVTHEVYDLGAVWLFRFTTPYGQTQLRLTRADLTREDWSVHVPEGFIARLRTAGAPPSPEFSPS